MSSTSTYAIILSGGKGLRVECRDKGLLKFKEKKLITWVIQAIKPHIDDIVISCNRNQQKYHELGFKITEDDINIKHEGPIAGILSASKSFSFQESDYLLITPCDTPKLPSQLVPKLKQALKGSQHDVAVVFDGRYQQNLHCLLRASMLTSLEAFFENGGRAIKHWFAQVAVAQVNFSEQAEAFTNFNQLEQLDQLD